MRLKSMTFPSASMASPFDDIADSYDEVFTGTLVGRAQRRQVWEETDRNFRAGQRILEINCGTGVDALHLARRGVRVVACDSSSRMVEVARRRIQSAGLDQLVDLRGMATEQIGRLEPEAPFDGLLSNFSGLNCVEDLAGAARSLARLLRPGAKAVICLFGPCCLWEIAWHLAHGNFRGALRRFRRRGAKAYVGGCSGVRVYYPTIRRVRRLFAPHLGLETWRGIGVAIPPSYLEFLAAGFPGFFQAAEKADPWLGRCFGIRSLADHVLLTFERARS